MGRWVGITWGSFSPMHHTIFRSIFHFPILIRSQLREKLSADVYALSLLSSAKWVLYRRLGQRFQPIYSASAPTSLLFQQCHGGGEWNESMTYPACTPFTYFLVCSKWVLSDGGPGRFSTQLPLVWRSSTNFQMNGSTSKSVKMDQFNANGFFKNRCIEFHGVSFLTTG